MSERLTLLMLLMLFVVSLVSLHFFPEFWFEPRERSLIEITGIVLIVSLVMKRGWE